MSNLALQAAFSVLDDHGHRCFLVSNENAVRALARVFAGHRLKERFTFDAGETTQTLFSDNATVLMQINDANQHYKLKILSEFYANISEEVVGPCALSLITNDPEGAARRACRILGSAGFAPKLTTRFMSGLDEKFKMIECRDACLGWSLCFRRHALMMGKPVNMRVLTNLAAAGV